MNVARDALSALTSSDPPSTDEARALHNLKAEQNRRAPLPARPAVFPERCP
jgi:hypothetical protein